MLPCRSRVGDPLGVRCRKFVKEATVSDKELKVWPGLYHEIMNEGDGVEVAQYAANWLKARL